MRMAGRNARTWLGAKVCHGEQVVAGRATDVCAVPSAPRRGLRAVRPERTAVQLKGDVLSVRGGRGVPVTRWHLGLAVHLLEHSGQRAVRVLDRFYSLRTCRNTFGRARGDSGGATSPWAGG
jgi:hypothetical protein